MAVVKDVVLVSDGEDAAVRVARVVARSPGVAELLCEVLFSGFGYGICKRWKKEEVGKKYFEFSAKLREETR